MRALDHLPVLPMLVPIVAAAVILLFDERRRHLKATLGVAACVLLVVVSAVLVARVAGGPHAYRLGDWPSPFGIVLVADRLSALMVLLASVLGLATLVFSLARWHRAGAHFHTLFQILLAGLNGAFLTGDLFNLFVFFEVMLAASFGLVLHGSGPARIRAGLHYIVVNLVASFLFLLGVSLVYGMTGTLNMADLAVRFAAVPPGDRTLLEAGAALLGVAFLVKAGMWPFCFWLPPAYTAASAPVAAVFVITSKVGVYILLRLSLLVFGPTSPAAGFGANVLLYGGLATVAFGMVGVLASRELGRIASFSVIVSSGTLLAAIGLETPATTAGALFYLVSSSLALCALFLLVELVGRGRDPEPEHPAGPDESFEDADEPPRAARHESEEIGAAVPAVVALLALAFLACALLVAGLPPLSGFVAKFALMSAMLDPSGAGGGTEAAVWVFFGLLLLSGLAALLAMMRTGTDLFWTPREGTELPRVRVIEFAPVSALVAICIAITVFAEPVMAYMRATAEGVHIGRGYIDAALPPPAPPAPGDDP